MDDWLLQTHKIGASRFLHLRCRWVTSPILTGMPYRSFASSLSAGLGDKITCVRCSPMIRSVSFHLIDPAPLGSMPTFPRRMHVSISDETEVATAPVLPANAVADPAPLGLAAFALTTFLLSAKNAGWRRRADAWLGFAFAYGGFIQLLAGMWEFGTGTSSVRRRSPRTEASGSASACGCCWSRRRRPLRP